MVWNGSSPTQSRPPDYLPSGVRATPKIVIGGGFGAGKTTMVTSLSEIAVLRTEQKLTLEGASLDVLRSTSKTTTTVVVDFGRVSLSDTIVLYLFGLPGQRRFHTMWPDLARGALGAVLLLDTRCPADAFPVIDLFEELRLPFVVAVNEFPGSPMHADGDLREALAVPARTPVVRCDARVRASCRRPLVHLVRHLMTTWEQS